MDMIENELRARVDLGLEQLQRPRRLSWNIVYDC